MSIPYGYIYGLRCKENGKWYIGQTTQEHCANIKKAIQIRGGNKGIKNPNAKVVTIVNRDTGEKHIGILKELANKLGFSYVNFIKRRRTKKYIQEEVNNVNSN